MTKKSNPDPQNLAKENQQLQAELNKLKKIRDELSKYKFISNAAEDFMTLVNKNYEYEAVNQSYCREHGIEKSAVLGKQVFQVWGRESFEENIKNYLDLCFKGEIVRYQDWFNFASKGRGYYDVIYYPYYNQDDKVTHSAVVTRNITKQKNIEIALRKSKEKYKKLVEGSFDLIFTLDNDFKFEFVSSAAERLFDLSTDAFQGNNFAAMFSDSETHSVQDALDKLKNQEKLEAVQLKMKKQNGEYAIIELNTLPIIEDEKIRGYQGVIRDLTKRRELEKKQKHLEHELIKEHRLASIGMLTSGLAHNIRSPLSVILGAVQILELEDRSSDRIDMIKKAAKKIEKITDSMMMKLRKEQDESKQPININKLLQNELEIMKGDLKFKHEIDKEYEFCDDMPTIMGVYNDFSQALTNIIDNAIDSMYDQDEKILKVSTEVRDDRILVKIIDTGCGIEKDKIEKLFDPFYTSKPKEVPAGSDQPRGTGLGLYSCYNMLQPYNVKFNVESEVGEGTKFELQFPISSNQN